MKKITLISFCILLFSSTSYSQLKLYNNGRLSLQTSQYPNSDISIGGSGNSNYTLSLFAKNRGFYCELSDSVINSSTYGGYVQNNHKGTYTSVGIRALTITPNTPTPKNCAIGLWGQSANANRCIGVMGVSYDSNKGAGVYGTVFSYDYGSLIPNHLYAGYFRGDVGTTGDLTVDGSIQGTILSDALPDADSGESERIITNERSFAELFSEIKSYQYYKGNMKGTFYETIERDESLDDYDGADTRRIDANIIAKQIQSKKHYALSAVELEEVLPDLVYTKEDGTKSINYIEIIPLLIQSIGELNDKYTELCRGRSLTRSGFLSDNYKDSINKTKLYQNSPNPFSAQTEIRFSLPDDAKNAYIYIFDMTGKMQKQIAVDPSMQSVTINGYELQAGIYLYSLVVGGQEIDTKRMILSK